MAEATKLISHIDIHFEDGTMKRYDSAEPQVIIPEAEYNLLLEIQQKAKDFVCV